MSPKEIRAILTETLACFFPSRANDLSAPLLDDWLIQICMEIELIFGCLDVFDFKRDVWRN